MQNGLNDTDRPVTRAAPVGNDRLREALAKRDRYLDHHPHLRPFQAEIDRLLDKSGGNDGRMAVLGTLMQGKLLEMQKELNKLSNVLLASLNTTP